MRKSIAGIGDTRSLIQMEPDAETTQKVLTQSTDCGICLESIQGNSPIVLAGCHHVFCFSCLKQWNDAQTRFSGVRHPRDDPPSGPTCPLCRQSMPHVAEAPVKNALQILAAAGTKKDTEEVQELCQQALQQIEPLLQERDSLSTAEQIQLAVIEGGAALYCKTYDDAIGIFQDAARKIEEMVVRHAEIETIMENVERIKDDPRREDECNRLLDKVVELNEKRHAKPGEHISMLLKVGEAQRLAGRWKDAKTTYQDLATQYMQEYGVMTPQQTREMLTSMSESAYQLGRMDMAIDLGEGAIEMNRYFPWSHKFVALAKLAENDLEGARQTAAEAVIYEAPWDDKHKEKVQQWYRDTFMPTAEGNALEG